MLRNRPYAIYIWMRIPLTIATMLPTSLFLEVLKYIGKRENSAAAFQTILAVALLTCFVSIPVLVRVTKRMGKTAVLWKICILLTVLFLAVAFVPGPLLDVVVWPFAVSVGVAQAMTFIIPDAILADIIDYDFLRTGTRTEGMYTILESNVQQYVEIIGGVLPSICMGLAGFTNNGGCACGCGVPCPQPFLRWQCPGDIGYACSTSLDASLLFGPPDRPPPCTVQNDAVQVLVRIFALALPGLMYLLAAIPAYMMPIDRQIHTEILRQIDRKEAGELPVDPLTRRPLRAWTATPGMDHLWAWEVRMGRRFGLSAVLATTAGLFALWIILTACLMVLMYTRMDAETTTFGSLGLAALFILLPWEGQRLRSAWGLRRSAAAKRLEWRRPSELPIAPFAEEAMVPIAGVEGDGADDTTPTGDARASRTNLLQSLNPS
eukprot:GGOE01037296.1.p1 GENE.GGOE01037296.1~~GGOE01037296.1.p1  ORF type:complete len:434 (-),score=117.21 GGOE01037296.1:479-1780(-)